MEQKTEIAERKKQGLTKRAKFVIGLQFLEEV
jgi:hypothetical protein